MSSGGVGGRNRSPSHRRAYDGKRAASLPEHTIHNGAFEVRTFQIRSP